MTLRFWHIHTFSGLLNSLMLFSRWCMYVLMYVCMHVCISFWMSEHDGSKRCILLSSNLICILQVTVGRTLLIFVNIGWIFFYRSTKKNSFRLRPMESHSLMQSSIQMVHSTKLRFGMSTILHIVSILANLRLIVFFYRNIKKNYYALQPMESN